MIKFLVLFIYFFTVDTSFSKESIEGELKDLANKYVRSILSEDKALYKSVITKSYLDEQTKVNFLKEAFTKKTPLKKENVDFDFIYKKAAVTKDKYFINIKEKHKKDFDEDWFVVIKEKGSSQYKIHSIQHMED
jgi:hypothetical protein